MKIYCRACDTLVDEIVDAGGKSICGVCKRQISLDGIINELQSENAPEHPADFKYIEHESETEYVFKNRLPRRVLVPAGVGWAAASLWGLWPLLMNAMEAPSGHRGWRFMISFNLSAFSALIYFLFKSKVRFSQGSMYWGWKKWPLSKVSNFEIERQSDARDDKSYIVAANIVGYSEKLFHYNDKTHAEFVQFRLNQALDRWTGRCPANIKQIGSAE